MSDPPSLDAAYALQSPDAMRKLYADWAQGYDTGFGVAQGYQLPAAVARAFRTAGGQGPVLDVGAGTGLVGERLARAGVGPLDALDLSPQMLAVAADKGLYRDLVAGDLFDPGLALGSYKGLVSAGTFTLGHVGPEGIAPLLRWLEPGALAVISVNLRHFEAAGFAAALAALDGRIDRPNFSDVRIYDDRAEAAHRDDMARLVTFRTI